MHGLSFAVRFKFVRQVVFEKKVTANWALFCISGQLGRFDRYFLHVVFMCVVIVNFSNLAVCLSYCTRLLFLWFMIDT